ncbi:hypothetical protein OKW50_007962 [Paraburkholderia youngii]|uniref:hypothetical protein n=1 Tax=Paraburkholderia youngii TaxID=2782701 RepID=UPI003D24C165
MSVAIFSFDDSGQQSGNTAAAFAPRFDIGSGRPFNTEVDALTGKFSAARRVVDRICSVRSIRQAAGSAQSEQLVAE